MVRTLALLPLLVLAACKPPASDDYLARTVIKEERAAPRAPIASPDTEGAAWAPSPKSGRLLYGLPGEAPLLSLACQDGQLVYTRYVAADANAKAVLALIGNGHVERLWVDAEQDGAEGSDAGVQRLSSLLLGAQVVVGGIGAGDSQSQRRPDSKGLVEVGGFHTHGAL